MILERNKKIVLSEEDSEAMKKIYEEISEVLGSFFTESAEDKKEGQFSDETIVEN